MPRAFSYSVFLQEALDKKIQRAKNLSRGNVNKDWDVKHPDWVRDIKTPTVMIKQIKDEFEKHQKLREQRRLKLVS